MMINKRKAPKNPEAPFSPVPGGIPLLRELLRLAGLDPRRRDAPAISALVIGCRTGGSAVAMAQEYGCSVAGIDTETESILAAKVAAKENRLEELLRFRVMSPLEMDFPEKSMGIIFIDAVLNANPKTRLLKICRRLLEPGGKLIVTDSFWIKKPAPTYVRNVWEQGGASVPTMEEWRAIFADAGFAVLHAVDASSRLEPFYRQFAERYANPSDEQLVKLGSLRHIVPRYRHESNVFLHQKGAKWMGFAGFVAEQAREVPRAAGSSPEVSG